MSIGSVEEYLERARWRYVGASKTQKGQILDEVCGALGYHRKAAIRTLRRGPGTRRGRRGRPNQYGPLVVDGLRRAWEAIGQPCGKRLGPFLPELVERLESCGEMKLGAETRAQLVGLSPATIDRRLKPYRRVIGRQPYRASPSASAIKAQVPIRTFGEWEGVRPGSVQADLVLHCGQSVAGFFLTTLLVIDVATGWTECEAIWGLGKQRVATGLHHVRGRLPMELRELHTDNGSEFLNTLLVPYCQQAGIRFTRGRPYRKNDQAYAEQRNGSVVRQLVGYDRYSSHAAHDLLRQFYGLLHVYLNFFQPTRKLVRKERRGARVLKVYDRAATPYQRLMASGVLGRADRERLQRSYRALNPVKLLAAMDDTIEQLHQRRELPVTARYMTENGLATAGRLLQERRTR